MNIRLRKLIFLAAALCATTSGVFTNAQRQKKPTSVYYPAPGDAWQHKQPEAAGLDSELLNQAVAYAKTQASTIPPDFSTQVETFGRVLGPLPKERGETNGMIVRHGYIVAEWGNTKRVDPTYSVAKSFLSTLCGLAVDRGMIKSVKDPVKKYVSDGYDSPHNANVTWEEHLQQTSEWEGTMWGKKSDFLGTEEFGRGQRKPRALQEPGAYWEYNDVRINRMSLSLLEVWQKPLPRVLKDEIMDRIGASDTWQYHGYNNSTVVIKGQPMASVSGGTRWGGGLWISTRDEARFGYLFLRQGNWKGKQIVSSNWVRAATTPTTIAQDYGYLWWLNTAHKQWPSLPATSFAALGYGSNTIWIDPEHDLVVVWRWHKDRSADEFFKRIL
ncbi:MAG: beta-lactamase family protein, partial [Acidobacteriota bacterium]|nr:beta-lactamase family protein [Acidobacteriota bacterium]